jgi:hypothetical protein
VSFKRDLLGEIFKWFGRISAVLLFLFWGAFWIEHLTGWFISPKNEWPPVSVWVGMVFHTMMLIGLALMVKWDKLGTLILVLGTVAFFTTIHFTRFPFIAFLNAIPIVFFSGYWLIVYLQRKVTT